MKKNIFNKNYIKILTLFLSIFFYNTCITHADEKNYSLSEYKIRLFFLGEDFVTWYVDRAICSEHEKISFLCAATALRKEKLSQHLLEKSNSLYLATNDPKTHIDALHLEILELAITEKLFSIVKFISEHNPRIKLILEKNPEHEAIKQHIDGNL